MLCLKPYVKQGVGITQKMVVLSEEARAAATPFPCGKCINCRINKARVWTNRLLLEQISMPVSCFVTLTYDDEHMPEGMNLKPEDMTLFLKRLRYYVSPAKIRYYYAGEYGDRSQRPHYHAALFGIGYDHQDIIMKSWEDRNGKPIGYIMVGDLTEQSARYICGYVIKGWNKNAKKQLKGRVPEFARMSRKPGIGGVAAVRIGYKLRDKNVGIRTEFQIGNKKLPLGKYMSERIGKMQKDVSRETWEVNFWKYQQELFELYMDEENIMLDNLNKEWYGKRRRAEKRNKLLNRRNKI